VGRHEALQCGLGAGRQAPFPPLQGQGYVHVSQRSLLQQGPGGSQGLGGRSHTPAGLPVIHAGSGHVWCAHRHEQTVTATTPSRGAQVTGVTTVV
jgi:hypothetical protein